MATPSRKPEPPWPPNAADHALAVLVSGGLDSAILLAEAVRVFPQVYPLYVRVGAFWETVECEYLLQFLATIATPSLQPLTVFSEPIADVYGPHWSRTGCDVPGAETPDEAVFLPGRNVLLLTKPLLWCLLHDVPELATAPLAGNPFPDATPAFYDEFAAVVSRSVQGSVQRSDQGSVRVIRPYADLGLHKAEVLLRGGGLPLELTFSCIRPVEGLHCGRCNKCAERQTGFRSAAMPDPTVYSSDLPRE